MTGKEVRERLDTASADLSGDTGQVRRLVFDLVEELRVAGGKVESVSKELDTVKKTCSDLKHERASAKIEMESLRQQVGSLRQQTSRQAASMALLEGQLTALKSPPTLRKADVIQAFLKVAAENLSDSEEVKKRLQRLDADRKKTLAYAIGLNKADPELEVVTRLSNDQVGVLFHLGFSEFELCKSLLGDFNKFLYEMA